MHGTAFPQAELVVMRDPPWTGTIANASTTARSLEPGFSAIAGEVWSCRWASDCNAQVSTCRLSCAEHLPGAEMGLLAHLRTRWKEVRRVDGLLTGEQTRLGGDDRCFLNGFHLKFFQQGVSPTFDRSQSDFHPFRNLLVCVAIHQQIQNGPLFFT